MKRTLYVLTEAADNQINNDLFETFNEAHTEMEKLFNSHLSDDDDTAECYAYTAVIANSRTGNTWIWQINECEDPAGTEVPAPPAPDETETA